VKLDPRKYREILSGLGPVAPVFTKPDDKFREWLSEKRVPTALATFLIENAVCKDVPFEGGCGGMWTPEDIMALNDQESAILACRLLALGNSTNGDFIAIDLTEGIDEVGFVSHDELWENPPGGVREIFIPVDKSIHEMLAGMSGPDDYPADYSSAIERRQEM